MTALRFKGVLPSNESQALLYLRFVIMTLFTGAPCVVNGLVYRKLRAQRIQMASNHVIENGLNLHSLKVMLSTYEDCVDIHQIELDL